MKKKFQLIYLLFSLVSVGSLFISSSGGYDGNAAGAPIPVASNEGTCSNCHFGGSGGTIALTGAPAYFTAGQTYSLTLSMQHPTALKGGFQIVATNGINNNMVGTFSPSSGSTDTRLTYSGTNRLTHNGKKDFSGTNTSWTFNWTAPASGLPSNIVFYYAGNAVNNTGGTDGDAVIAGSTNVVVPIELLDFSAEKNGDKAVHLTWKTASERNNRFFNVQRSPNNQKFETIGQLKGSGSSSVLQTYQFTDDAVNTPNNVVYYRLQQVDFDGTSTYSKTVSVSLESKWALKIYPSFAQKGDVLTLETVKNATIDVLNSNGKVVQTIQQATNNSEKETLNIPTSDLPSGRYFVRFVGGGLYKTGSFIVL
jgi:hypothetical protein